MLKRALNTIILEGTSLSKGILTKPRPVPAKALCLYSGVLPPHGYDVTARGPLAIPQKLGGLTFPVTVLDC